MNIEDINIGDALEETDKYKNQRNQFYKQNGFLKGNYTFYDEVDMYVTDKTKGSVQVFVGKKTNKGVDSKQWMNIRDFNFRFLKK